MKIFSDSMFPDEMKNISSGLPLLSRGMTNKGHLLLAADGFLVNLPLVFVRDFGWSRSRSRDAGLASTRFLYLTLDYHRAVRIHKQGVQIHFHGAASFHHDQIACVVCQCDCLSYQKICHRHGQSACAVCQMMTWYHRDQTFARSV